MFKKIIASVLTLGAFVGLISTANINSVSAEEDATTLTDLYYFDFSNSSNVDKMKNEGKYYSTCLNTGKENSDINISYLAYTDETIESNATINATGSSIDIGNNTKSFTNAFSFNPAFFVYLNVPSNYNFTITLNYVTSKDGILKIYNIDKQYTPIKEVSNCSSSKTQTLTIESAEISKNSDGAYHFTNSSTETSDTYSPIDIEIIEMLVTVKKESNNVSAKAYAQDGSSINNESSIYYQRFIAIVDGVSSIYDLYNVEYKLTYTYKDSNGTEQTKTATVKPHVVDTILKGSEAYTTKINKIVNEQIVSEDYTFSNKENTKYLVYTVANAKSTTTDGVTSWEYDYSGKVKVEVVLNGTTIATTTTTMNAKHQ